MPFFLRSIRILSSLQHHSRRGYDSVATLRRTTQWQRCPDHHQSRTLQVTPINSFQNSRPPMSSAEPPVPKRTFPPLYKKTGNPGVDRLAFFHIIERLKTQKRTGWTFHKIAQPESIADHMYRMAMLALCCSDTKLDIAKCVMLCVVHDLAEAQVGDIAPREGIPKLEKQRLEAEAMHNFVHDMLHNSPAAQRIEALWQEYEAQETDEARFVKDLDRFEMALQASDYEISDEAETLQDFFENSLPSIKHPEVQSWGKDLETERARRKAKENSESS